MALSQKYLTDCGITPEKLKKLFTAEVPTPKIVELTSQIINRVYQGRLLNLRDFKYYAACDMAFDAPFQQSTATIVKSSIAGKRFPDVQQIVDEYKAWGMEATHAINEQKLPNNLGKFYTIDPPRFSEVIVPLTTAYLLIRVAKIFNDRNQSPFLRYTPSRFTRKEFLKCEIISDLENKKAVSLGYTNLLRQAILQGFHYSTCWMIPSEMWYSEQEPVGDYVKLKEPKKSEKEEPTPNEAEDVNPKRKTRTKREGLRYHLPHPTRTYYDLKWRPSTINSDSGISYFGHWSLYNYSDLKGMGFWNLDTLPFGKTDWLSSPISGQYFKEVYPCVGQFPCGDQGHVKDRPGEAIRYSNYTTDAKVFLTDHFQKIVPKEYGFGDCEFPVWFRFVVGNESTVFYAEPLLYTPALWLGIDVNELAPRSPSLTLQILPFQDQISNILSQILNTQKQNLSRVNFYNTNFIDKSVIDQIKAAGDAKYAGAIWVEYDGSKFEAMQGQLNQLFTEFKFQPQDISPLVNSISTIISIMERLLNMSPQEVGATASHEQTREEIRTISGHTSQRVAFSGYGVDDFMDAWKRQLFDADMAYGDDQFVAQVAYTPEREKLIKEMGFTIDEKGDEEHGAVISGKLSDLRTDTFAPNREGPNRPNDQAVGQIIMQTVTAVASNPLLAQAIGAKPMLELLTEAAVMAGAPRDFRLMVDPKAAPEAQQAQVQEQLSQVGQDILGKVMQAVADQIKGLETEVVKALAAEKQQVSSKVATMADQVATLSETVNAMGQAVMANTQTLAEITAPPPPPPPMPPPGMMPQEMIMPPPVGMPGGMMPPLPPPMNLPPPGALPVTNAPPI